MNKLPFIQRGDKGPLAFDQQRFLTRRRIFFLYALSIFFVLLILVLRLFQLTVVKGTYYRRLSEQNRVREITIEAKRGNILDRNGAPIVESKPAEVDDRIIARFTSSRIYTGAEALGHIIGYRQNADEQDFKNDICLEKLQLGDKVGKKGIEKIYECDLRGKAGRKLIETDARGKPLRTLSVLSPQPGKNITLSIDLGLQKKAFELLNKQKGAIIALKPQTGEVLTMAANPSFDPQVFENNETKKISTYFTDEHKPLFNRAAEGVYPPGSIFKLFIASGALEEKKLTPETIIEDTGTIKAGAASFGNWYYLQYGKTDGPVNMVKALQRSNDIYFYKAGEKLSPEKIKKWAELFGFGDKTGSGLEEATGTIPSPFWKDEVLHEAWYLGDTYNYSIGQGYTLVTPLQSAFATAVFANRGYLCTPQLLKTATTAVRAIHESPLPTSNCKKLPLSQQTIETVREGMKRACQTGGTGWPFFDFRVQSNKVKAESTLTPSPVPTGTTPIPTQRPEPGKPMTVGCKTGTAEAFVSSKEPHAWFTVMAPFDKPEIVVTVLLEEAGQGSDKAAPLAKDLLKYYFER